MAHGDVDGRKRSVKLRKDGGAGFGTRHAGDIHAVDDDPIKESTVCFFGFDLRRARLLNEQVQHKEDCRNQQQTKKNELCDIHKALEVHLHPPCTAFGDVAGVPTGNGVAFFHCVHTSMKLYNNFVF